jgi:thiol-disulfide isomerase/thioredoxin
MERITHKRFVAVLAIVSLFTIAYSLDDARHERASAAVLDEVLKVGDKAPDFVISTSAGSFHLAVDGKRRPTLLEVFATWCPHCQREAAVLASLAKAYRGRASVIGVAGSDRAMDRESPETEADIVAWSQIFGAEYPVAFDPSFKVANDYLSAGFPTVVLIGTDGRIQGIRTGEIPLTDLSSAIDASISGQAPDPGLATR